MLRTASLAPIALTLSLVAVVASTNACNLLGDDPCDCGDMGGGADSSESNTEYSCDGNTLVVTSAPVCGPGCNSPKTTRTDCGASMCITEPGAYYPYNGAVADLSLCAQRCHTTSDCPTSQYCATNDDVCLADLTQSQSCTPGNETPCGPGLACLPNQPASISPTDAGTNDAESKSDGKADAAKDSSATDTDAASDAATSEDAGYYPVETYSCQPAPTDAGTD